MKVTKLAVAVLFLLLSIPVIGDPSLRVLTIAGTPGVAGLRDGSPASALFDRPTWIEQDDRGRLYVIDRNNDAVRAIGHAGVYTLQVYRDHRREERVAFDFGLPFGGGIAVEPRPAGCGAGPWASALIVSSTAHHQVVMVVDEGSAGEYSWSASRDDIPTRVGLAGQPGSRDGYGASFYGNVPALLNEPGDIALSANYVGRAYANDAIYIVDSGNHTIRRVLLGMSFEGCNGLLRVETLAGSAGQPGWADGIGASARFHTPRGIATAPDGSIYVSDSGNHVIRRITPEGVVTTVAGQAGVAGHRDGPALDAQLNLPSGLAINEAGELFIADTANHVVRKLTRDGRLVTIAGTPGVAGHADGAASTARFAGPVGIALSAAGIIVGDTSNHVIRRIEVQPPRRRAIQPAQ